MSFRGVFWGVVLVLGLGLPSRADYVDVITEKLHDNWTRYTYTLEDPTTTGLQSFVLHSEFFQEIREIMQPFDWVYYVGEDRLTWARDAFNPDRNYLGETIVFSFESSAPASAVYFSTRGICFKDWGEVLGPGEAVLEPTTIRTPEPTSLSLMALGSLGYLFSRRWRREPG